VPALLQRNLQSRKFLQASYLHLREQGFKNIHYLEGESLIGDDGEATVDGTHPTDLGFMRIANSMITAIHTAKLV
jgi:hypothetical protein